MTLRELLQTELWSKRTTQKILVAFGTVFAVLAFGFFIWREVSWHWLTPGERRAAKAALVEIDLLQNAQSMSGKEFDSQEEKAQLKFDAARNLARTYRDRETVAVLSYYFISTTAPWDQARFNLDYPGFSSSEADLKSDVKRWISDAKLRKQVSSVLDKELD